MSSSRFKVAVFNDTNTTATRHYGCSLVMFNLVEKLKQHHMDPIFFWPVGVDWRDFRGKLVKELNCDAIIVNGEGSIHHSSKSEKPKYLSQIASFAKEDLKIPAYLVNSTIYDNEPELYEYLNLYKKIYVRESSSKQNLQTFGVHSEIVPDLTLSVPFQQKKETVRVNYLVTDSTFQKTKKELERLGKVNNWDFISMKVPKKQSLNTRIFKKLSIYFGSCGLKRMKKLFYLPVQIEDYLGKRFGGVNKMHRWGHSPIVNHQEFVEKIAGSKFVITGRFHTVTLCLLTETPFIALNSNTPKISSMLGDIFNSTARQVTMNELQGYNGNIPSRLLNYSDDELKAIRRYTNDAEEKADDMFSAICQDLENQVKGLMDSDAAISDPIAP